MYLGVVILTMLVLPVASVALTAGGGAPLAALALKWFVVWGVGVRLLLAGARQIARPRFTLDDILGGEASPAAETLVRELGVHNLALGTIGVASVARPDFIVPAAVAGALFYAVAGVRHAAAGHRRGNEAIAMVSDLGMAIILVAGLIARGGV